MSAAATFSKRIRSNILVIQLVQITYKTNAIPVIQHDISFFNTSIQYVVKIHPTSIP